ncbi:MAG: TIGR03986 family CRISPR-associated RAMP protein [Methanothrix sp.]|jgi:CRISPR-associated protein (TIGR03986 family)|nr:TIGR03986 family CRISPR-associated RAMP protein [Methanothrix sp.]
MIPHHSNPSSRKAHAPYNFIPLPEQIVQMNPEKIRHDIYEDYTGYLDCILTTLTPTYVRAAFDPKFFACWSDDKNGMMKNTQARETYAQFFHLDDAQRPIIPGSSLRGMTRALIEIVGFGKIQWVTRKNLFFRTLDNTAVGEHYRNQMADKVEGGFLRKTGEQYTIRPCQIARIHRDKLGDNTTLYEGKRPSLTPRWTGMNAQYEPVWVKLFVSRHGKFVERIEYQQEDGLLEGRLIITGDVPNKKKEFVFILPDQEQADIAIPPELIERFHSEDQISQWQEKAFPQDRPQPKCRQKDGMLRKDLFMKEEGDPVFFLREGDKLTFFGRAQMFRLPYHHSPYDLIPVALHHVGDDKNNEVKDLSEAIFGYVAEENKKHSNAGRVFFTDAICESGQKDIWLPEGTITPKILSSPKPTTFQHYLVQDRDKKHDPDRKGQLAHYGTPTPEETIIRGHKLYWHKQDSLDAKDFCEKRDQEPNWESDTQHTRIKPVSAGKRFSFRVYFENLTNVELGVLLWVLDLPEGHHHKIGMGKPLGLGSVTINLHLILTDRLTRYNQLLDNNTWYTGEHNEEDLAQFKSAFEQYITHQIHIVQEERNETQKLAQIPRIQMLLKMLQWPGPEQSLTKYMEIDSKNKKNEFRERPVLPDALNLEKSTSIEHQSAKNYKLKRSVPSGRKESTNWNSGLHLNMTKANEGSIQSGPANRDYSNSKSPGLKWLNDLAKAKGVGIEDLANSSKMLAENWEKIEDSKLKSDVFKEIKLIYQKMDWWDNAPAKNTRNIILNCYKAWEN